MDEVAEELEHQEFLDILDKLAAQVFLALWAGSFTDLKSQWDDIAVFGDDPVFIGLVFDKIIEETDESH